MRFMRRVRLNNRSTPGKQPTSKKDRPHKSDQSTPNTFPLPRELDPGLDKRTASGKAIYRRLRQYVSQISGDGARELLPAEVASLKMIMVLEAQLDDQLGQRRQRLDAEDLRGLSSELRRQLSALGLDGASTPTSTPKDDPKPEPMQGEYRLKFVQKIEAVRLAMGVIVRFPDLADQFGPLDLDADELNSEERAQLEAAIRRLVGEAKADEAAAIKEPEGSELERLRAEVARLKRLLQAKDGAAGVRTAQEHPIGEGPCPDSGDDQEAPQRDPQKVVPIRLS